MKLSVHNSVIVEDPKNVKDLLNKRRRIDIVIHSESVGRAIEMLRDVILSNHYTTIYVWVR